MGRAAWDLARRTAEGWAAQGWAAKGCTGLGCAGVGFAGWAARAGLRRAGLRWLLAQVARESETRGLFDNLTIDEHPH